MSRLLLSQFLSFSRYEKAAEQKNAGSQYALAGMYETGRGVEKNLQKAYSWCVCPTTHTHTHTHS
jgi:TPR repeat protein